MTDIVAITFVIVVQVASMVVVFMMLTGRGWWKKWPEDVIDWTSTDDCHACWEYGPYEGWRLGGLADPERAREMHKAQHALIAPAARMVVHLLDRVTRRTR